MEFGGFENDHKMGRETKTQLATYNYWVYLLFHNSGWVSSNLESFHII